MIGLILGASSVAGALFDFVICKFFKSTNFKKIFLIMFLICSIYPLLLWQAKTVWFFLFVMALWGLFFDLYRFGVFNFVGRYTITAEHSASFGVVQIFKALGALLAPLIVGTAIIGKIDWRSFSLGWLFLAVAFIFFVVLLMIMRKYHPVSENAGRSPRRKNLLVELRLWKKLGKIMMPVLLLTLFLYSIEAFFWTLAPLYTETTNLFGHFGGLFLSAYLFPTLIVGWCVGSLTKYFGKKRTALWGLLIGSIILSSFRYLPSPIASLVVVLLASLFISMALPAINAAYADYISEASEVEGEIVSLENFACNIGYILGPISAGILADMVGIKVAFSVLGVFGAIVAFALLIVMPRSIEITIKPAEL